MRGRIAAALASAAMFSCGAAGQAQTAAPAPGPVLGPTAAPVPVPAGGAMPAAPTARPARIPVFAAGPFALDTRALRGTRGGGGYRLSGEALVKDACTAARFAQYLGNVFPPSFTVVQYRRPGTAGLLCIQRLTWVTLPALNVPSASRPLYVSVRSQRGIVRVPIRPLPSP